MSSIMIQDMAARRVKDYTFNWQRMLSFEGDTGPYLQYAHARLCSIERGAKVSITAESIKNLDCSILKEPQAIALIDFIASYPSAVHEAAETKEPVTLVKYCLRLSQKVSSAISEIYVQNQPDEIALPRLAMYVAARYALGNALRILGLNPLERM
jgi:arginyl-tRNA synthetase